MTSKPEAMAVEEAVLFLQEGAQEERLDMRMHRAARTIVEQDDLIERLRYALHKADRWGVDVIASLKEDEILQEGDV